MSDTVEILRKAKQLVQAGWCKGYAARDANDSPVDCYGPQAVSFCMYGAIERVRDLGPFWDEDGEYAEGYLEQAVGCDIADFNDADDTGKPDVLAAFDRAIAAAEKSDA